MTHTLENTVTCSHCPGHLIVVDSIPDDLQNQNCNIIQYQPGVGLHPNPALICGDEYSTESIVEFSSSWERGRNFLPGLLDHG
jgi:hypothetical protein